MSTVTSNTQVEKKDDELIKEVIAGKSADLLPKITDTEPNVKIQGMIKILMQKGMIKFLEIEKSKNNPEYSNVTDDDIIDAQYITNVYKITKGDNSPADWTTISGMMNNAQFVEAINNPDNIKNLKWQWAVLYYKAFKSCLSSKISQYRLHKEVTKRENKDTISGTVKSKKYNDIKSVSSKGLEASNVKLVYDEDVWNSIRSTSLSEIIFGKKNVVFDNLYKYGVITLTDINAFVTIYLNDTNRACKFKRIGKSIGLIALPTSSFERTQIKEADAHIRTIRNKMYTKIGKTKTEEYMDFNNSIETISSLA